MPQNEKLENVKCIEYCCLRQFSLQESRIKELMERQVEQIAQVD